MNSSNACQAFIFAAGLGTRLRPITEKHPKPTIPLFGIPLGYYILPYLDQLLIKKYIANTFHLPEQIHQLYKSTNKEFIFLWRQCTPRWRHTFMLKKRKNCKRSYKA